MKIGNSNESLNPKVTLFYVTQLSATVEWHYFEQDDEIKSKCT